MSTLPGRARRARRRVLPLGFVAAVAAMFVAISPVMADTVVKKHGKTGIAHVSEALGDVSCFYDKDTLSLLRIDISAATIFARNTTAQEDTQTVGWHLFVKRTGGGLPTATQKSPVRKGTATDGTSASFNPFAFVLDSEPAPTVTYSLFIKFYWFKPNGTTVAGWSKHSIDNYTWQTSSFVGDYPAPACQGHWG